MGHLIVIPPPAFNLPPSGANLRMASAAAFELTAPAPPKTLGELLRHKRGELLAFANIALASAAGIGSTMSVAAASAEMMVGMSARRSNQKRTRTSPPKKAEVSSMVVLEGVGALVMPEEMVDRAVLEGAMGATVVDNFFVPLAEPVSASAPLAKDWHLKDINVAAAAGQGFRGGGILVGVLDTGIAAQGHPEFAGKNISFAEFDATGRLISNTVRDAGTHGTHVCGIVAGRTAGVSPEADLAVAAVLTVPGPRGLGGYFAQILGGMNWLLTNPFKGDPDDPGVDVMNASLGGVGYNPYYYSTLANARLITGTVLVAAIGNSGPTMNQHGSPGNYDIVVGVGATDTNHDVAPFSDSGVVPQHGGLRKPDLCAPGHPVWSSLPGGGYGGMSGTSMASPVVTGALALLIQKTPAYSLNATGLINRLRQLVAPLSGSSNIMRGGLGRLDLSTF